MKKPALVVMAAGMGSRYGGLKQIDPVDKEGDIIIDFSIYDALQAGFEPAASWVEARHSIQLSYWSIMSGQPDSNRQRSPRQGTPLPLRYSYSYYGQL